MQGSSRLVLDTARSAGAAGAGLLLVAIIDPVTKLLLPSVLSSAVDTTIAGKPGVWAFSALLTLLALSTVTEALREALETRSEATGSLRLRRRVLRHVLSLGGDGRHRFGVGDLLGRLIESTQVTATGTAASVSLLTSLCTSLGGLLALFWIDVWLGVLFLLGAPLMWLLTRWLVRRVGSMTTEYQRLNGEIAGRFVDAVRGSSTIRANGTAESEVARVLAPLPELNAAGQEFWEAQRKVMWQAGLLAPALQIAVLAVAGLGVLSGRITPGELLAAQLYQGYAQGLLKQTAIFMRFARARGAAERVQETLDVVSPPSGEQTLPPGPGRLALCDVHFQYDGHPVLSGVDLEVPPGSVVAVVGASGAGKSTLVEVAGGLLTPDSGHVLLDGVRLADLAPGEARRAFGYAAERPHLLGDTVAEAVAYSDEPPSPARVSNALRVSAADGFVQRLPHGARTPVRDLRLSGGELQRLGLARAAARRARVVILDDVTSSVDTATEVEITNALESALRGTTRLVVAHRMSTAKRADLVAWLRDGVVQALAPHDQLMRNRDYRAVFQPRRPTHRDSAVERARDPESTIELSRPLVGDPESTLAPGRVPWV